MAKKKKAGPDLISLSELAHRAGVTRAAVTMWIKQQEAKGVVIAVPLGRRGKAVDANDKLVMRYINNTAGKSVRPGGAGQGTGSGSNNTIRKIQFQTRKIELQNMLLQEKYISYNAALALLDELEKLETELFAGWSDRVLDRIEAECKIKVMPEERMKAKEMIETALNSVRASNRRIIAEFKKNAGPKTAAEKRE